ncbi:uncharacterized protein [Argopecten irradians]|uniref:uncharacterized protein n=1 Tax=Argopecten irradians TaxID=31199 RepID=UPI00371A966F
MADKLQSLSCNNGLDLKDFRGSEEERKVKSVLKMITTETDSPTPSFVNLVLQNSNAKDGARFSDAYISLRLTHDCTEAFDTDYGNGYPKCGLVYLKDILNKGIIEDFLEHGVDAIQNRPRSEYQAFLVLLEFILEKRKHEESITKLITTPTCSASEERDTHIMIGLIHHLFTQLVPYKKYTVHKNTKHLPKECGCGCQTKICVGNTSIGSLWTWHGHVDVLFNDTVAMTYGRAPAGDAEENKDDDTDEDEPHRKQRKLESGFNLLEPKILKQIFAQTITNGFAQVNRKRSALSHFLIPTFGVTSDSISICLYDPDNDCLLHVREQLMLWCPGQLNLTTIIVIWLFLNFTTFTQKNLAGVVDLDRSGLHLSLQQHLEYYRKADISINFPSTSVTVPPWKHVYLKPKVKKTNRE